MEEIDDECARPGQKSKPRIGWFEWLQSLKNEAERRENHLEQEGKSTAVVDVVIDGID